MFSEEWEETVHASLGKRKPTLRKSGFAKYFIDPSGE
jgi:hypothetical protein